ncbi:hypothetical protein DdX_05836 [Ditylenchus destructor]|uniref:Uncharacterized protein n=1 Tax=Ditylenchus destructor TaxID=166010 RepID=A0AAD4NAE4_9BILA|nr:hypothetical protein DdX_05836 [Ditylenchus destructor]
MYWRDMFPHFSRKEIVKLQFSSRFLVNAIEKVKPAQLHIIENLYIRKSPSRIKFATCKKDHIGNCHLTHIAEFCPPNYVRFSDVTMSPIMDADFLQLLKTHKSVFSGCKLLMMPISIDEESANKAFTTLMDDVFTECQLIVLNLHKWNLASQLNICAFSGVKNCDILHMVTDEMVFSAEDPLLESMFQWLHSNPRSGKKELVLLNFGGCESLLRKLMQRFNDDVEPHCYGFSVNNLNEDFFNEFLNYSSSNSTTQEELIGHWIPDDNESGFDFHLYRVSTKLLSEKNNL